MLREGLGQLLAADDDVEVVGTVETADELVALCCERAPSVVLVEAEGGDAVIGRMAASIRRVVRRAHDVRIVGLTAFPVTAAALTRMRRAGLDRLVTRSDSFHDVLSAVRGDFRPHRLGEGAPSATVARPARSLQGLLTARELTILSLIGAGLTSRDISGRLNISHKTVENHKQRMYAKLDVQSQAHAVSVAMRSGLLQPEGIVELAVAD